MVSPSLQNKNDHTMAVYVPPSGFYCGVTAYRTVLEPRNWSQCTPVQWLAQGRRRFCQALKRGRPAGSSEEKDEAGTTRAGPGPGSDRGAWSVRAM